MEESDDHEGNPSVGNTANREEQLSVESGSNSSWFRWGGGSAAASLIIWLFLHLPEYIKAADGWASLPEKTPKISGLLKSEKSREQPPVQDKPVIPQAPPPTNGSIDPAKDVPCADWGQARDALRDAAQKSFGAERDVFSSQFKGRSLCAPGWPLIAADPLRDQSNANWIVQMPDWLCSDMM